MNILNKANNIQHNYILRKKFNIKDFVFALINHNVSVLGREEGYTVKYTPEYRLKEFPRAKPQGTPEG